MEKTKLNFHLKTVSNINEVYRNVGINRLKKIYFKATLSEVFDELLTFP